MTESPPKLTPTSLPRSRGSNPNVVLPSLGTAALKVWGCRQMGTCEAHGVLASRTAMRHLETLGEFAFSKEEPSPKQEPQASSPS